MITSLAIISKCNEPLQMRILDSVINYVLSNEFVRKAEEEASKDFIKFQEDNKEAREKYKDLRKIL